MRTILALMILSTLVAFGACCKQSALPTPEDATTAAEAPAEASPEPGLATSPAVEQPADAVPAAEVAPTAEPATADPAAVPAEAPLATPPIA